VIRKRKPKWKIGDILRVSLPGGRYSLAFVMEEPLIAFFDVSFSNEENLDTSILINLRPAFKIWVTSSIVTNSIWPIVGHIDLPELFTERIPFFKKDILNGALSITYDGSEEIPATQKECEGLERAAIWSLSHAIERLQDLFEHRPSAIAERVNSV